MDRNFQGIQQGSLSDPLLFIKFVNNIFFLVEKSGVCNFADNNRLYLWGKNLLRIKQDLICDIKILLKLFKINSLKDIINPYDWLLKNDIFQSKKAMNK